MDYEKLKSLVAGVKKGDDAQSLLAAVRTIVYSDRGFDSLYRIDNFELTEKCFSLSVGSASLRTVCQHRVSFAQKADIRRVA